MGKTTRAAVQLSKRHLHRKMVRRFFPNSKNKTAATTTTTATATTTTKPATQSAGPLSTEKKTKITKPGFFSYRFAVSFNQKRQSKQENLSNFPIPTQLGRN